MPVENVRASSFQQNRLYENAVPRSEQAVREFTFQSLPRRRESRKCLLILDSRFHWNDSLWAFSYSSTDWELMACFAKSAVTRQSLSYKSIKKLRHCVHNLAMLFIIMTTLMFFPVVKYFINFNFFDLHVLNLYKFKPLDT